MDLLNIHVDILRDKPAINDRGQPVHIVKTNRFTTEIGSFIYIGDKE